MSTPNPPGDPSGPPPGWAQSPGYNDYPAYPGQPYPAPSYAVDPSAPYGRDPATGRPLSDKSAVAAGCLQLLLGTFGVGRFYIGSLPIGFVQLGLTILGFITTFFIIGFFILLGVGIWAFIDAIMMFTGSVTDSNGRKLR